MITKWCQYPLGRNLRTCSYFPSLPLSVLCLQYLEPRLERYSVKWKGSEFTSALASSQLLLSGAIRTFTVRRAAYGFQVNHPTERGWSAEIDCKLDDGTEVADKSKVTCLFLYYTVEHIDTDDADGNLKYESRRSEYSKFILEDLCSTRSRCIQDSDDESLYGSCAWCIWSKRKKT